MAVVSVWKQQWSDILSGLWFREMVHGRHGNRAGKPKGTAINKKWIKQKQLNSQSMKYFLEKWFNLIFVQTIAVLYLIPPNSNFRVTMNLFNKFFGGHKLFSWGHWGPVLDFWWCLPWVLKPGWINCLWASSPACNRFLRFTSGATPADYNFCFGHRMTPLLSTGIVFA